MVVPAKNNQTGVTRLLEACLRVFAPNHFPAEILLVDNLSHPPVEVLTHLASSLPVRLLICVKPGAAAARNLGARQAQTPWILFLDSRPGEKILTLDYGSGLLAHFRTRLSPRFSILSSRNSVLLYVVLCATDVVIAD
jgi:glycosyltransferase involved in cell wall biosynthesis